MGIRLTAPLSWSLTSLLLTRIISKTLRGHPASTLFSLTISDYKINWSFKTYLNQTVVFLFIKTTHSLPVII